ncbi:hypothetical protein Tco_0923796 [Tanacetum coccineum]|uniref:Uncharacterized protein n=1 Tax=Tanacetum coccineum TaxID=301880 RepID=A0ABQ5D4S1_9ASTR
MHQPWRTFAAIINRRPFGKDCGLTQALLDIKVDKKQENRKKRASQIYGAVLHECLSSPVMRKVKGYKTYLGFSTGEVPPKVARKFKKASLSSRSELVPGDENVKKKGKKIARHLPNMYDSKPTTVFELTIRITALEKQGCDLKKDHLHTSSGHLSCQSIRHKRSAERQDTDVELLAGSDQGLKKRKTSKEAEPTTGPKKKDSTSSSSKGTKSQPKLTGKSVQ